MKKYRIVNIVFYKAFEGEREVKEATIFYRDGSAEVVSYDEAIDACEEIVKERNITSKDAFKEMINNEIIHVVTTQEFVDNFYNYVNKEVIDKEIIEDAIDEKYEDIEEKEDNYDSVDEEEYDNEDEYYSEDEYDDEEDYEDEEDYDYSDDYDSYEEDVDSPSQETEDESEYTNEEETASEIEDEVETENDVEEEVFEDDFDDEFDDSFDEEIELEEVEKKNKKEKKSNGLFNKLFGKIKKSSLGVKLTAIGTALALSLGLSGCSVSRKSKIGQMTKMNNQKEISSTINPGMDEEVNTKTVKTTEETKEETVVSNDNYDNYTYKELLEVTTNKTQKTAMQNLEEALNYYNKCGITYEEYMDKEQGIRAFLSFDEISALQQAYNDFSKDEIRAIFNGAEIRADKMSQDYKTASLQLVGAYVVEDEKHPVDMSMLLEDSEARDFYNRYHTMFLEAKKATGKEKLEKVKAFYDAVKEDFPITDDVRTVGLDHTDNYAKIEAYKLAVTPMIAASEMMYQNLEIDYTLNDSEIDFINDIGLCNYADDTFERIETISISFDEDDTNPLYSQYKTAIIKYEKELGIYPTSKIDRDLSKLKRFQDMVNYHFETVPGYSEMIIAESSYTETTTETTTTTEEEKTWEEEETETHTETEEEEEEIPEEEQRKIDEETEEENEEEKRRAEEEAEAERKRLQEETDEEAKRIKEEIEQEEEDMRNKIDEANKKIEENNSDNDPSNDKKVNEKDFGDHNVDFDDEHSDKDGNLDPSVQNITPDGTGANEEMPDPNETGKKFDSKQPKYNAPKAATNTIKEDEFVDVTGYEVTEIPDESKVEYVSDDAYIEYGEEITYFDEDGNPISAEELVNSYIEKMENATETNAVQYVK